MITPHTATAIVFVTVTRTFELEIPVTLGGEVDEDLACLKAESVARVIKESHLSGLCVGMKMQRVDECVHTSALVRVDVGLHDTRNILVWCCSGRFTQLTGGVCDLVLALLHASGCKVVDKWNGYGCDTFSTKLAAPIGDEKLAQLRAEILKCDIRGQSVRS